MSLFTIDKEYFGQKLRISLNIGNRHFSIFIPDMYDPTYDKFISYNKPNKYVDSEKLFTINTPLIGFEYLHDNYNEYVHCILDEDEKYYTNQNVDSLKACMRIWATSDKFKAPFLFNHVVKDNGSYIYYITIKRGWFVNHNLGFMETMRYPDCYMLKEEINKLFPNEKGEA